MKIIWSLLASNAFADIRDSIFARFGYKAEQDFISAVDESIKQVSTFPGSGQQELELAEDGSVRSIQVHKLTKIIYFVEDDILHIADVWATRQDPANLTARWEK